MSPIIPGMSEENSRRFLYILEEMCKAGHGEVSLVIVKGRVKFIQPTPSIILCDDQRPVGCSTAGGN